MSSKDRGRIKTGDWGVKAKGPSPAAPLIIETTHSGLRPGISCEPAREGLDRGRVARQTLVKLRFAKQNFGEMES
jgi:hypothetical protein